MGVCFDSGIDPCSSAQSFICRAHQRALRCRAFFSGKTDAFVISSNR